MRHYRNEEFMDDMSFPFRAIPTLVPDSLDIHTQEYMAIVLVVEGTGKHEIDGVLTNINEGDAYLVEPGTTHAYHIEDNNHSLKVYNVIFDPSLIESELEELKAHDSFFDFFYAEPYVRRMKPEQPHLNLQRSDRIRLRQMIESFIEEDSARTLGYHMYIKTMLIQVLIFLSRCNADADRSASLSSNDEQEMMGQICDFISLHRSERLTLEQMSRMCRLGTSSFSVKFKNHTGQTFIEYRNSLRIHHVCAELIDTDHKIAELAMNAGFDDLSHFNKLFRSLMGSSPGEYRKSKIKV